MTIRLVTDEKIAETSSKGNQEKWYDLARSFAANFGILSPNGIIVDRVEACILTRQKKL